MRQLFKKHEPILLPGNSQRLEVGFWIPIVQNNLQIAKTNTKGTCTHLDGNFAAFLKLYTSFYWARPCVHKGPGKRGHIVADTLLPTQMFPCLPARELFVADTNFVSGTHNLFLILFRNILCPQQMFPSLRSLRNIMSSFTRALKILPMMAQ